MITQKYLTQNRTYASPQRIAPKYVVVHSTARGYRNRDHLWDSWNTAAAGKSCHGMVDDAGSSLTLPLTFRGWHVGGAGNGLSVGFEICEPMTIAYADAAHSRVDASAYRPGDPAVRADFIRRWENAAELAARMCGELGIAPENVLCHREMNARGLATNHADVLHWFPLFGEAYGMDAFRQAVKARLTGGAPETPAVSARPGDLTDSAQTEETPAYVVRIAVPALNVRSGPGADYLVVRTVGIGEAYTITQEREGWGRLKSGAGWIALAYTERK